MAFRSLKKFLPGMAIGSFSTKLTLHMGDNFDFMKQNQDASNMITDSWDPLKASSRNPITTHEDGPQRGQHSLMPGRGPVAAPGLHQEDTVLLLVTLPHGGTRLLHCPHLSQQPDWLHALQQKPEHQLPEAQATSDTAAGGAGAAAQTCTVLPSYRPHLSASP